MTIGAKLQALVEGQCISLSAANELADDKKAKIEQLNMSQIHALLEVRDKVGEITTASFI